MTLPVKIASATTTALLALGAVLIGGGTPLGPREIADATTDAARNAAAATENTAEAVRSTRALGAIADNVRAQLGSSRDLLQIQLDLEGSSREAADRARRLERAIGGIERRLRALRHAAEALSRTSADAGTRVEGLARSGRHLESDIHELARRFDEVVDQSRELNRKARGFARLRDPIP